MNLRCVRCAAQVLLLDLSYQVFIRFDWDSDFAGKLPGNATSRTYFKFSRNLMVTYHACVRGCPFLLEFVPSDSTSAALGFYLPHIAAVDDEGRQVTREFDRSHIPCYGMEAPGVLPAMQSSRGTV